MLRRGDKAAVGPLAELFRASQSPAVRLQALCALDGLRAVAPELLEEALNDAHPAVRRHAVQLSERLLETPHLGAAVLQLVNDPDAGVRYQLALSLGEWDDPRAGYTLGQLAKAGLDETWLRTAVLSSASRFPGVILRSALSGSSDSPARQEMVGQLIATAIGSQSLKAMDEVLVAIAPAEGKPVEPWHFAALGSLLDALKRKERDLDSLSSSNREVGLALRRIKQAFADARGIAQDQSVGEATRIVAAGLLGRTARDMDSDLERLKKLLTPQTPPRLQAAALAALGRTRSPKVPELLLAEWSRQAPSLRSAILATLLQRDEWIVRLLDAVEQRVIAPAEVAPVHRQRLLKHKSEAVAKRAGALLAVSQSGSRAEVVVKYQSAIDLIGDPLRGHVVFATNCSSCHAFGGEGHAVGPDLTLFRAKSPQDFLVAILDPSAAVEPRFINYQIETKDRRSLSGVVKAETAGSLTLVQGDGREENILRSDIAEIRASDLSLMPEGLEQNLSPQDLADLIAYVKQSGPRKFGSATPEQASRARAELVKSGVNGLAKIISAAGQLPYPGWLGTLPMPFCRQTDRTSRLVWETAPVRSDLQPDQTQIFRLPAAMGYFSQPSGSFQLRINGKEALEFNATLYSQTWQSQDGRVRLNYTVVENNDEDSNGILQVEVPGAWLEPGKPATFDVIGSATDSQRWFGVYLVPVAY